MTDYSDHRAVSRMLETLGEELRAQRIQRRTYQALLEALRPVIGEDLYDTYKLQAEFSHRQ